jgi:hypothetical protein
MTFGGRDAGLDEMHGDLSFSFSKIFPAPLKIYAFDARQKIFNFQLFLGPAFFDRWNLLFV